MKNGSFHNEGVMKKMNKGKDRLLTIENDSVEFSEMSN